MTAPCLPPPGTASGTTHVLLTMQNAVVCAVYEPDGAPAWGLHCPHGYTHSRAATAGDEYRYIGPLTPPEEVERLRAENAWREEALERIAKWAAAYPTDIFPEPDDAYYKRAHEVLTANGMTLDRLSAAAMRHVVNGVGEIARAALETPHE